jgi:hypothetical protein
MRPSRRSLLAVSLSCASSATRLEAMECPRKGCKSIVTAVTCVISSTEQELRTSSIVTPIVIAATTIVTAGIRFAAGGDRVVTFPSAHCWPTISSHESACYRFAALRQMLEAASESQTQIMCFVGNPGCIQILTGSIRTLKPMGPWFNILDPSFNLHLREGAIHHAWVVRKPTRDGIVTSLELFDEDGFCFVQFFGERKPGKTELDGWREIVAALPRIESEK